MEVEDFIDGPDELALDRAEGGPQEETCKLLDDFVTPFSPSEVDGVGWTEWNGSGELEALKLSKGHVLIP